MSDNNYYESWKCCGNCYHMENRIILLSKEIIAAAYPDIEDANCYGNTLLCRKGRCPKHADNACDLWVFDNVHKDDRSID